MKNISRQILVGALTLILLSSACTALERRNPTPVWTIPPEGQTEMPTTTLAPSATPAGLSITPMIPITGENVVAMQCQFCVDVEAHAILIFPDFAYFDVVSPSSASCLTADVVNGQRILICRGAQSTTFSLNVCSDPSNCLQFPVALQECPLAGADGTPLPTFTPFAPFYLTPINTLQPPENSPTSTPTPTITGGTAVPTRTPIPVTNPPTLTLPPPILTTAPPPPGATTPPPTDPPAATNTVGPSPTIEPTNQPTSEPPTNTAANEPDPTQNPGKTPKPTKSK